MTSRFRSFFVIIIVSLAMTLPLLRFGHSLWLDEGSSVWFARLPVSTLLLRLCDPHPAGYYLALKLWMLGGESESWLRLLSLLAAAVATVLTMALGKRLGGSALGVWAGLMLVMHPLQVWYAAEARMFTLAQVLSLASWLPALRLLFLPPAGRWPRLHVACFWLCSVMALAVDYTALIPLLLLQMVWLGRGRPRTLNWLGLQGAVILPLLLWWSQTPLWRALQDTTIEIFLAVQANRLGLALTPQAASGLVRGVMLGGLALAIVVAWRWGWKFPRVMEHPLWRLVLVGAWLGLIVLATVPRLLTVKRQFVVLLPYLALLTGAALMRWQWPLRSLILGFGLVATLAALVWGRQEPWREVVASISASADQRSSVVWVDELAAPVLDYYSRRQAIPLNWTAWFGRRLPALPAQEPPIAGDLFLVTAESPYRDLHALLPPDFWRANQLVTEQHETGIGLYHYRRVADAQVPPPALRPVSPYASWGLQLLSPLDQCGPARSGP